MQQGNLRARIKVRNMKHRVMGQVQIEPNHQRVYKMPINLSMADYIGHKPLLNGSEQR